MKKIRKAVIPAAGLGTRFLPATKAQPKEMLPIVDTPAIQYIVKEALDSGIEEILIITGKNKRAIEDHFDANIELEYHLYKNGKDKVAKSLEQLEEVNVQYVRQRKPKGLGDAIYCAKTFIGDEAFAVLLGDDIVYNDENPCLKQLIECYEEHGGTILGAQIVPNDKVSSYGIVAGSKIAHNVWYVDNLVEKPAIEEAPSNLAVLGRYILSPDIFSSLEHTKPGKGGEVQLTDAIQALKSPVFAIQYQGRRYDVGDKLGYLEATVEYALRNKELSDKFKAYLINLINNKIDKEE